MPDQNNRNPQPKLIEIIAGEVFRLKVPMEVQRPNSPVYSGVAGSSQTARSTNKRWKIPAEAPASGSPAPAYSGSVNSYLVRSAHKRWAVIDPGLHTETCIRAWSQALEQLQIGPNDIEYILITHCHPDHSGMAGWFASFTDAPMYMHPQDIFACTCEWGDRDQNAEDAVQQLQLYGLPGEKVPDMRAQVRQRGGFVSPYEGFLPLGNGDEFPVSKGSLQVMLVPGHSDGQCILLWPERKLLFSADLLLPITFAPVSLRHFGEQNPVGLSLQTLNRFLQRNTGGMTILPGHGWPFGDPAGRARLEATHYHEKSEWYCNCCAAGNDNAWDIALEYKREHGGERHLRFLMAEAMAYLEYLAALGRVRRIQSDIVRFVLP